MKMRKWIPATLLVLLILAGLSVLGYRGYQKNQEKYVRVNGARYEKDAQTLVLSGGSLGQLEELKQFPNLKKLDLRGTDLSPEDYTLLESWFPDVEIIWDVPFQGEIYPMDTRELTVAALTEEDLAALAYFPELKRVTGGENCTDYAVLHQLKTLRPDLEVSYTVNVLGTPCAQDVKSLVLPGAEAEALMEVLPYLPELENVELTAPLAEAEKVMALVEAMPQVHFSWELEIAGIPVDEMTETLDLTGIPMTVEQMDAVLPYLPSLTYVDMTDCGISNEEMDALNRRYENIKIVWTVLLGGYYRIRTDTTAFMPVKDDFFAVGDMLHNLRYCTDMIAIDVGHMRITNIDFVAYMPHLKYLLLCQTAITDLTPLTGLEELVYLELFMTEPEDLSPLVTLTALEDLNLHYVKGDPEIIAQMTWLKNLWWNNLEYCQLTYAQQQMLREAIPGCHFNFTCQSSTGGGWRQLPNYYAQRDIFGMHYMNG